MRKRCLNTGRVRRFRATSHGASNHQPQFNPKFSGDLIGDCGFHVLENEVRQAEFGISLVPEFQCRGYATEVLRALLNYLFVELNKQKWRPFYIASGNRHALTRSKENPA
jgi:RimJ/RimL family protein N-acetyltransferase